MNPVPGSDGGGTTTLVVHVENKAGVLARVAGLFARRGFNIESLAVAPTVDERFSRLTIVVGVDAAPMEQVVKQLDKLVNVVDIQELNPAASVERELMMVTVRADSEIRGQILDLVRIFQATVLNVGYDEIMVSLTGSPSRVDDFEDLLRPYGIVDVQRTGKVALSKLVKNAPDPLGP
ncbi:MAG: acetolactate synthase small subunit [bacterium]|nr:acetolactate synthase small subunit [bacterium]MCY3889301.1 acetolactate synthase small subunit [bacterium]MCY3960069.1 acetolactate synthase small subunit [bacterium]MCY4135999.1 acetolactate synthase small subunit [bacterium]